MFVKAALAALSMLVVFGSSVLRANTIIVCKASDPSSTPPVTGTFGFVLDGTTSFSLTVGGPCERFDFGVAGAHTVTETAQTGVVVSNITVDPLDRLVSFDLGLRTVTANAVEGIGPFTTITFFNKSQPGTQGCTPGFWKQTFHFGFWVGFSPTQLVSSVFTGVDPSLAGESLATALEGGGGQTLVGKEQILLRAAVAALLNASNSSVSFPFTISSIISSVNAAIASGDLTTIVNLATQLDNANNGSGGCPLSGQNP